MPLQHIPPPHHHHYHIKQHHCCHHHNKSPSYINHVYAPIRTKTKRTCFLIPYWSFSTFGGKYIFKTETNRSGNILVGRGLILKALHMVTMIIVTVIVKQCCGSLSQTCLSPQEPLFALVSTFLLLYYHHPSPPLLHPCHIPENHHNDFHNHNYHWHLPFFFLLITIKTAITP